MAKAKTTKVSEFVESAIEHLKKREGFDFKDQLGKGTYGSVIKVGCTKRGIIAAKIVQNKVVNLLEIREWPKLSHPNVLRLLDTIYSADGVVVFLTELMDTNLFFRLQDKEFKKSRRATEKCCVYARQVLLGLDYLHKLELCHLDLRAENVFMSSEDKAVVADFSGLCRSSDLKKFCPLPHSLRPPEMLGPKKKVAPTPIDLWAYGLLLANLFLGKGFYICTVKHPQAGTIFAAHEYRDLFKCETYVDKFTQQTYPSCPLTTPRIRELISLISLFLQEDPRSRIKTEAALENSFFNIPTVEASSSVPSSSGASTSVAETQRDVLCDAEKLSAPVTSEKQEDLLPAPDSAGDKSTKLSKWQKYKSRIERIKSVFQSPPRFKSDKPNQKKKLTPKKRNSDRARIV